MAWWTDGGGSSTTSGERGGRGPPSGWRRTFEAGVGGRGEGSASSSLNEIRGGWRPTGRSGIGLPVVVQDGGGGAANPPILMR